MCAACVLCSRTVAFWLLPLLGGAGCAPLLGALALGVLGSGSWRVPAPLDLGFVWAATKCVVVRFYPGRSNICAAV